MPETTVTGEQQPTPPDAPEPGEGRKRLLAAMRRTGSRAQVIVAVLLAILGFAAVAQVQSNGRDDKYVGARQGELIQLINNLSLASQRAEQEIAKLQQTRDSLLTDTEARRTALERAREQATSLGILAGTLPATGPGVRITVTNATGVGTNQLLNGLEELRDAGAEAMEVNDSVRVIAQTSLHDAPGGGAVIVDGKTVRPPYVIDVIGEPHTLATALNFSGGFDSEVRTAGGTVAVKELPNVDIATIVTPQRPKYAQPAPTE